jgi:DNA ligase 1
MSRVAARPVVQVEARSAAGRLRADVCPARQRQAVSFYSDYTFGCWDGDPDAGADLLPVGKAYSGFTDEELKPSSTGTCASTRSTASAPVRETDRSLVFEVAFDSVHASKRHKSGLAMRFPRIRRIRWDKPAHEADRIDALRALVRD